MRSCRTRTTSRHAPPPGRGPAAGPGAGPARRTRRTAAAAGHRPKVGGGGGRRIGGLAAGAVSLSLSESRSLARSLEHPAPPPVGRHQSACRLHTTSAHSLRQPPLQHGRRGAGYRPGTGGGLGTRASRRRAAGRPTRIRFRGIRGANRQPGRPGGSPGGPAACARDSISLIPRPRHQPPSKCPRPPSASNIATRLRPGPAPAPQGRSRGRAACSLGCRRHAPGQRTASTGLLCCGPRAGGGRGQTAASLRRGGRTACGSCCQLQRRTAAGQMGIRISHLGRLGATLQPLNQAPDSVGGA